MSRSVKLYAVTWRWRDRTGLLHDVVERVSPYRFQDVRHYVTGCGQVISVDDVPKRNRVFALATCLRCAIAPPNPDMVPRE